MQKNIFLPVIILVIFLFSNPIFAENTTVDAICDLGVEYYNQGRYEKALVEFNDALALDPQNTTAKTYIQNIFNIQNPQPNEVVPQDSIAPVLTENKVAEEPVYPAKKEINREQAINNAFYIAAAYNINHMHYSEWADGNKFDEDFGTQRGYDVAVGYRSPNYYEWARSKPFVEVYFRRFGNIIRYKGALQDGYGDTIPYNTLQRSIVQQYGLKLGGTADCFSDKGTALAYLDLGERIWHRGEDDSIYNYGEKYYWTYIGIGAGLSYRIIPKLSIGGEGEIMFAPGGLRKMHADSAGGLPDTTFSLGLVWGVELKAPIKYYLLKNLSLDVTPYFTYWKINKSNVVAVDGGYLQEPESNTHLEGLLAGFTYSF